MFDTRRRTLAGVAAGAVAAGSVLVPATPVQADHHGHMDDGYAHLTHAKGFPHARGPVVYHSSHDSHHAGMDEEFHLVLRGVKRLAGKRVRVLVHGDLMGRVRINEDGRARLHRHDGLGDMHDGWGIRVRTGSGKLVARAQFDGHME